MPIFKEKSLEFFSDCNGERCDSSYCLFTSGENLEKQHQKDERGISAGAASIALYSRCQHFRRKKFNLCCLRRKTNSYYNVRYQKGKDNNIVKATQDHCFVNFGEIVGNASIELFLKVGVVPSMKQKSSKKAGTHILDLF